MYACLMCVCVCVCVSVCVCEWVCVCVIVSWHEYRAACWASAFSQIHDARLLRELLLRPRELLIQKTALQLATQHCKQLAANLNVEDVSTSETSHRRTASCQKLIKRFYTVCSYFDCDFGCLLTMITNRWFTMSTKTCKRGDKNRGYRNRTVAWHFHFCISYPRCVRLSQRTVFKKLVIANGNICCKAKAST